MRLPCCPRHQPPVIGLRQFSSAHGAQMFGHELAVEQRETRPPHQRHQPRQRDLAGIRHPAEHAFPAEHPVKADAIKPARQLQFAIIAR
jgi:hypothetical protein